MNEDLAERLKRAAQERMRRLLLLADALEESSAPDVRSAAAAEIRQLCEWIAAKDSND